MLAYLHAENFKQKIQDTHSEGIHPQTIICVPALNIIGEPLSPCSRSLLVEVSTLTYNLSPLLYNCLLNLFCFKIVTAIYSKLTPWVLRS